MEIIEIYKAVLSKYATFDGRARRKEYWYFLLANFIVMMALMILGNIIRPLFFLYGLYSLAIILPSIAVGVRRLHDIGKAGIYYLFCFIPLAGPIILLVWFAQEGNMGDNMYGPDPKQNQF